MTEQTWHSIPRDKIPWQPTIDYKKCTGCHSICPAHAITHPSKKQTQEIIRTIRKEYPIKYRS